MQKEVYSGRLKLDGEGHEKTLREANNYASGLLSSRSFEEGKALLRKMTPVARRVLGENHELTIRMRWACGQALYLYASATLDDLREAVTTIEDVERTARRVLGGAHPLTSVIEVELRLARAALTARETPGPGDV